MRLRALCVLVAAAMSLTGCASFLTGKPTNVFPGDANVATAPGEDWIATVVEPVSFQAVSEEEPKAGPYLLDSGDHVRVT
ncbi:MAG: hypothetical protein ACR2OV_11420, partial [Hyphomicrobiaceae bacterium]